MARSRVCTSEELLKMQSSSVPQPRKQQLVSAAQAAGFASDALKVC